MNPETIKLDGITLTISQDKGRVFAVVNKGVFSFLEVMTPEQADALQSALNRAAMTAYADRRTGA
jgi:hypothetical protein